MDISDARKIAFASYFITANKLQTIGDRYLEDTGLTTKQWLLIVVILRFGEKYPTLSQVSEAYGASRQNVKQIAVKLEKNGFLKIEKDIEDSRILRIKLTDKHEKLWVKRQNMDEKFLERLFDGISDEHVVIMAESMKKIMDNINRI